MTQTSELYEQANHTLSPPSQLTGGGALPPPRPGGGTCNNQSTQPGTAPKSRYENNLDR
jgi:hypothetical protein